MCEETETNVNYVVGRCDDCSCVGEYPFGNVIVLLDVEIKSLTSWP